MVGAGSAALNETLKQAPTATVRLAWLVAQGRTAPSDEANRLWAGSASIRGETRRPQGSRQAVGGCKAPHPA